MTNKEFFNYLEQGLKSIEAPEQCFKKLEKLGQNPVCYKLTETGKNYQVDNNEIL